MRSYGRMTIDYKEKSWVTRRRSRKGRVKFVILSSCGSEEVGGMFYWVQASTLPMRRTSWW